VAVYCPTVLLSHCLTVSLSHCLTGLPLVYLRRRVLVQLGVDTTAVNQARLLVYIMVKIGYLIYAGIY